MPRKGGDPIGVRNFIRAPEGYRIVSVDYSQLELRTGTALCFLAGGVKDEGLRFSRFSVWAAGLCVLTSLLCAAVTGAFGAPLTAQLARPFFVLVRTLSFFRTVERVEALVVMLWIFPDFLITALFLWAGQYSLQYGFVDAGGGFITSELLGQQNYEITYRINGEETDEFPFPTELNGAEPVTETVPGWQQDISGVRRWEDLPEAARNYVEMIEKAIGCPIRWVSVGPERESIITRW